MPPHKGKIKPIGGVFSRKDSIKIISDDLNGISTELIDDVLDRVFSKKVFNRLMKGDQLNIPGFFRLRVPDSYFRKLEKKRLKSQKRRKEYFRTNPNVRLSMRKADRKYKRLYQHNKWREINGIKPSRIRIKRNTLLRRTMPSLKKMRERYPEHFTGKKKDKNNL